jgi:hypothetical protein
VRRAAFLDQEPRRMLADIRAEAGVSDVLALITMISDEDGDTSRPMHGLRDQKGGRAAKFQLSVPT